MIEHFIPVLGSRKNTLTNATVTGYISAIRHPSDRALICRIADGVDEDYVVANKSIAALLRSIMDDPITIITTARWTSVLVGNKTHPIQRRKPKSVPIPVPAETPSVNRQAGQFLQDTLDQKRSTDVLLKDLFSRTCLPVVRRESGVTPAKMIPITDKTIAIQKLNEAVKEMARQMIGQGEQIEWKLTIKSVASDKQDVHFNGPIEL